MEWKETQDGEITVLILSGDIDLNHSPKLRTVLQKLVEKKCKALLIDFTSVNYIDSSGLATLVEYFQGSRDYSGKITLAQLNDRVKSVFELVRLSEIFPIHPTLEEAKTSLTS